MTGINLRRPCQAIYVGHAGRRPGSHENEFDRVATVRVLAHSSVHAVYAQN